MHFVTCVVLAWKVNARQLPTPVCASCMYFNSCLKALPGCESWCVFGLTRLAFGPSGMQTVWSVLTWLWFTSRRLRPVMLFWETWLNISHLLKLCAMGGCFFFLLEFLHGFQKGIAGNLRQLVALHGRPWWLNSDWWLTGIGWAVKLESGGGWVLWKLCLIQLADTPAWPWFWVISTALSPSLMRGL